ncbi:hypothetical protein [Erythrobacter sp. Alg231-14]|uniref:hypothetical protein n=1 Tax=Erythrobacter sp. Alg231-14 TaxID=1922225 RepID=UPI00307BFCF7
MHRAIAALRSDQAAQRRMQSAMELAMAQWRELEKTAAIADELSQFDLGRPLTHLPNLHALMIDHAVAQRETARFFDIVMSALAQNPLGETPLRHSSSEGFARMQLMQSGGTTLSLCTYEPVEHVKEPIVANFVDCDVFEIVLAGTADGQFHTLDDRHGIGPRVKSDRTHWRASDCFRLRASVNSRDIVIVAQTLLVLQLSRSPKVRGPSREIQLNNNTLIRSVSGDKSASEKVMALAVLGALDHREGIGAMEAFAKNATEDRDARWEAVRQVLAMDSRRGVELLSELATGYENSLSEPASTLIQHLRNGQPHLFSLIESVA